MSTKRTKLIVDIGEATEIEARILISAKELRLQKRIAQVQEEIFSTRSGKENRYLVRRTFVKRVRCSSIMFAKELEVNHNKV
jgi:hypothetical protein